MTINLIQGDCLEMLKTLPDASVQCCVTSPPYYGLRNYNVDGQIGLEESPEAYTAKLVAVFREVRRVLRDDGTLFLNLGDSYAGSGQGWSHSDKQGNNTGAIQYGPDNVYRHPPGYISSKQENGLKPKDLIGIPWRVAFALQADGWWLRQDIIWAKPNPMPESVTDRCTKAHEYIFLLTKSARYFWDAEAVKEPAKYSADERVARANDNHKSAPNEKQNGIRQRKPAGWDTSTKQGAHGAFHRDGRAPDVEYTTTHSETRNPRSVWTIATKPCKLAHFATFPPEIPERCIKAGSREGDTILDPFTGAGTTGMVAMKLMRSFMGIELNPEYMEIARRRIMAEVRMI